MQLKKVKNKTVAGRRLKLRRNATPYLLLLPVILFVSAFMLWPMLNVFLMSLQEYKVTQAKNRHFIGLANFTQILQKDDLFWKSLVNSAVWVLVGVLVQTVLGFWLAYILNKRFKGRGIFRAVSLAPWALAGVMVGIIWQLIYGETYGVLNDVLRRMGIIENSISWFSNSGRAMAAVVIANIWRGIPFFAISYMSALAGIPEDVYESATIDGAGPVRRLFNITIPMIKDTIVLTTLLRAIWTFNAVDLIYTLTAGGPNNATTTLPLYIMNTFSGKLDYGYASALAMIATFLMMIVALVYIKLSKLGKDGMY